MSERLSELSASVSLEVRTRVQESRDKIKAASSIMEGLRKEPVIADGTRVVLDDIVAGLEAVDRLHVGVLRQVNSSYGHGKDEEFTISDDAEAAIREEDPSSE